MVHVAAEPAAFSNVQTAHAHGPFATGAAAGGGDGGVCGGADGRAIGTDGATGPPTPKRSTRLLPSERGVSHAAQLAALAALRIVHATHVHSAAAAAVEAGATGCATGIAGTATGGAAPGRGVPHAEQAGLAPEFCKVQTEHAHSADAVGPGAPWASRSLSDDAMACASAGTECMPEDMPHTSQDVACAGFEKVQARQVQRPPASSADGVRGVFPPPPPSPPPPIDVMIGVVTPCTPRTRPPAAFLSQPDILR